MTKFSNKLVGRILNSDNTQLLMPQFQRNLYWILGIPIDAISLQGAIEVVKLSVTSRSRLFISTPNLNFLIASRGNAAFASSLVHSDLCLADGMPIVWLARLLGIPIQDRVAGSSLFEELNRQAIAEARLPLRVFFFGGSEGAAEAASNATNSRVGGMRCVGFLSPGFGSVSDMGTDDIINQINGSDADFLVVALGAQKGQAWIESNLQKLKPPVVSHLGAVINFAGGSIKRAPTWVQRLGLEWVWRIKEEPSLWKRYWNDGLSFLTLLLTKAIPLALLVRKMKAVGVPEQPCACSAEIVNEALKVQWTGPLTHSNAGPLYAHFTSAQKQSLDVSIDLSQCTYVAYDVIPHMAAFALSQSLALRQCNFTSVSTTVATIFRLANAPFAITPP